MSLGCACRFSSVAVASMREVEVASVKKSTGVCCLAFGPYSNLPTCIALGDRGFVDRAPMMLKLAQFVALYHFRSIGCAVFA